MQKVKFICIVVCLLSVLLLVNSAFAIFVDNGDGTITDTDTGIIWSDASYYASYYISYIPENGLETGLVLPLYSGKDIEHYSLIDVGYIENATEKYVFATRAESESGFSGTFTAIPEYSSYSFDYSYDVSGSYYEFGEITNQGWLIIKDLTDDLTLYSDYLFDHSSLDDCDKWSDSDYICSFSGINNISVSTIADHQIYVDYGIYTALQFTSGGNSKITLIYSAAPASPVVPEPISSILFIAGGATLGLNRFRKRYKK